MGPGRALGHAGEPHEGVWIMGRLLRLLRRLAMLAIIVGIAVGVQKRTGLLNGECDPACACSTGAAICRCGHKTCLAPAPGM